MIQDALGLLILKRETFLCGFLRILRPVIPIESVKLQRPTYETIVLEPKKPPSQVRLCRTLLHKTPRFGHLRGGS